MRVCGSGGVIGHSLISKPIPFQWEASGSEAGTLAERLNLASAHSLIADSAVSFFRNAEL